MPSAASRSRRRADNRLVVVPAIEAAADAGLVGDDHQRVAGVAEAAERLRDAGEDAHPVGVGEVAGVLDQRAVAVEEEGRGTPARRDAAKRKRWKPSSTAASSPAAA